MRSSVAAAVVAMALIGAGCGDARPASEEAVAAAPSASAPVTAPARIEIPRVLGTRGHDAEAFTEGLVWQAGRMYESTGLNGESEVRRIHPTTGAVIARRDLDGRYFGEGLAVRGRQLVQLTWKSGIAFVWDRDTLRPVRRFRYSGEGWGLAAMGPATLVMSDGSSTLRVIDARTFRVVRRLDVRDAGAPVAQLNELEVVHGRIWANVWQSDDIVVIDPSDGRVERRLDLSGLRRRLPAGSRAEVLNGIAWDRAADRVIVTGKWWPRMFVIAP